MPDHLSLILYLICQFVLILLTSVLHGVYGNPLTAACVFAAVFAMFYQIWKTPARSWNTLWVKIPISPLVLGIVTLCFMMAYFRGLKAETLSWRMLIFALAIMIGICFQEKSSAHIAVLIAEVANVENDDYALDGSDSSESSHTSSSSPLITPTSSCSRGSTSDSDNSQASKSLVLPSYLYFSD